MENNIETRKSLEVLKLLQVIFNTKQKFKKSVAESGWKIKIIDCKTAHINT